MPTLAGITGASLQPGVDVVEALRQGAVSGEQMRQITERRKIGSVLSGGAISGGTTGGAATPGAAGPAVAGAKPSPMAAFAATGQIDTSKRTPSPIEQMEARIPQLRQLGIQGNAMADKLQTQLDAAHTKQDAAAVKEINAVATAARTLSDYGDLDRATAIGLMRANSGGDKNMLQWLAKLETMSPDEQKIELRNVEAKATTALEDRKQDREDRKVAQEDAAQKLRGTEAVTAQGNLEVAKRKATVAEERLAQDVEEYANATERDKEKIANAKVGVVVEDALVNSVSAKALSVAYGGIITNLEALQELEQGNLGAKAEIVNWVARFHTPAGDALAEMLGTPGPVDIQAVRAQMKQVVISIMKDLPKPVSDVDLLQAIQSAMDIFENPNTETSIRIAKEGQAKVLKSRNRHSDLLTVYNKEGSTSRDVMDFFIKRTALDTNVSNARDALNQGAPRASVIKMMVDNGMAADAAEAEKLLGK